MSTKAEDVFKAYSHPLRVKVVDILATGEKCVCELFAALGVPQSVMSQHLGVMKRAGVVKSQKRGAYVFYRLAAPGFVELLRLCREITGEHPPAPYVPMHDPCGTAEDKAREDRDETI